MTALPRIMVAPNGATRTRADHPALPVTLPQILDTARACAAEGADGLHLHLRDETGRHLLDAGAYREALEELHQAVPGMTVQITTEAAGIYSPEAQRTVALETGAPLVSVALREMLRDDTRTTLRFFRDCAERGIAVQHILFDADDAARLTGMLPVEMLRDPALQLIFVLGRYTDGQASTPAMLQPFLDWLSLARITPDWMVCAFGPGETPCLLTAAQAGGKLRVGFENSLWHPDGTVAADNTDRVRHVVQALEAAKATV